MRVLAGSCTQNSTPFHIFSFFMKTHSYIDATKSETDRMLDAIGVARFTTQDIVNAIQAIVFDAE